MAGFLGWVRTDGKPAAVSEALAALCHHESFRTEVLAGDRRVGAAVVCRKSDPPEVCRVPERGLVVAILGTALEFASGRWHRVTARELADRYLGGGAAAIAGLDGFYQMLVWDGCAQQLHTLNDRVGSMPLHFAQVAGGVAFTPEAKALFRLLPLAPHLDLVAAMSFLNVGYVIGSRTLFTTVRYLAPAHRLTLNLHSGEMDQQRAWVQRFEPENRLDLRGAASLLYEAIMTASRAPLGRGNERAWVAMTGGYDSRVLLHALNEAGRRPDLAVTWGATDAEPNSDPPVAKALAAAVGLAHRFYRYSAGCVASHVTEWGVLSEFASDNPGYFAAGPTLLLEHADASPDAMYIGDVVIASGGQPKTIEDAVTTALSPPLGRLQPCLERVLRADVRVPTAAAFGAEVQQVVDSCPSSQPEEVQDYLWTAVYNSRWLFSPGFYKEPMLTAWRPMLLGPAYDALARIPARLRVYRRVYVEMVRRWLPPPLRRPRAEANSLVDWQYESRHEPALRAFLQVYTDWDALGSTPIGELLDQSAMKALVTTFFSHQPRAMRRQPRGGTLVALRRRFAAAPVAADALRIGQKLLRGRVGLSGECGLGNARLLWRISLLARLHQAVAEGAFGEGHGVRPEGA